MRGFLSQLRQRNAVLFFFGWLCLFAAIIVSVAILLGNTPVLGVNAWLRPAKFLFSALLFAWTMGWLLYYLDERKQTQIYSWFIALILFAESVYTVMFAFYEQNHEVTRLSSFNVKMLEWMAWGVAAITIATGYFTLLFFTRTFPGLKRHYLWGIRFGLLFFVIFALSGNIMAAIPGLDINSPDGSTGLPFVNWRQQNGDLRVAHFLGMHSLQVLPLMGCYVSRRSIVTILFSFVYFLVVIAVFMQALLDKPLIEFYMG